MTDIQLLEFNQSDVFTPDSISQRMSCYLYGSGTLLEPAVGNGQLLKFVDIGSYESIDVFDIKQKYLDECKSDSRITKYNVDFIFNDSSKKYRNIILNPPFIRFQDLSPEYRKMLKDKWDILSCGNVDIYYAFLIKCIELLEEDGVMVSITPNSYIYNKSAKKLREYFIKNRLIKEIIDFKSEKVFKNISTYCCITVFTRTPKECLIYNDTAIMYDTITDFNIFGVPENANKKLGDICTIKNGIATLRDKIYIHSTRKYDEPCWKEIKNSNKDMWVIYPYNNGVIMKEKEFKENNPKTYEFLEENKSELSKRDKGKKKYAMWYAFGRTQSLVAPLSERVLYIPTFGDPNSIAYSIDTSKLFVGCLCLELKTDEYSLEEVVDILIKNKDFIEKNSLKRGGGWISISGTLLKKISL